MRDSAPFVETADDAPNTRMNFDIAANSVQQIKLTVESADAAALLQPRPGHPARSVSWKRVFVAHAGRLLSSSFAKV